jgi:hypothetical protein
MVETFSGSRMRVAWSSTILSGALGGKTQGAAAQRRRQQNQRDRPRRVVRPAAVQIRLHRSLSAELMATVGQRFCADRWRRFDFKLVNELQMQRLRGCDDLPRQHRLSHFRRVFRVFTAYTVELSANT